MLTQVQKGKTIFLGRQGEHISRVIQFDVSDVLHDFPGASFTILNQRPNEKSAYPISSEYVLLEEGTLNWIIRSADVEQEGSGLCELIATVGTTIAKSSIYNTSVYPALDGSMEPPVNTGGWIGKGGDNG